MHYQIYIPGKRAANPQHLIDVGLEDHVEGASFLSAQGPDEQSGVVVSWPTPQEPEVGYKPAQQTWIPSIAWDGLEAGRYWVGFWNREDPMQYQLARGEQFNGHGVELGNGEHWLVPCASMCPAELGMDDDGRVAWETMPKYRPFYKQAVEWHNALKRGSGKTDGDCLRFLLETMRCNYRLTPEVVTYLRLFNNESIPLVMFAALDELAEQLEERSQPVRLGGGG